MKLRPLALMLATSPAFAAPPVTLDEIVVTASRPGYQALNQFRLEPGTYQPDLASALSGLPGAAVVRNGQLTGIAQVRGTSGDRVNVLVDGMGITPACPNHMDPPLHYAAPADTESLILVAGISPVSGGGDALGSSIQVRSPRPAFRAGSDWQPGAKVDAGFSSANSGWNLGVNLSTGNQDTALAYAGNHAEANDLKFAQGTIRDTGYHTTRHKLSLARRTETGRLDASVGQHRTRDAGTPSLPMDMVRDDADWANIEWSGKAGDTGFQWRAYWHDIDHLMDNYSLRGLAGGMYAPAYSRDVGLSGGLDRPMAGGRMRIGAELRGNDFDASQWSTATGFSQDIMLDASRDRLGLYAEWEGMISGTWKANLGLRSDTVRMDTGNVRYTGANAAIIADQTAFNGLSHRRTDHNWDWNALFQYPAGQDTVYEVGLTRKTRAPSLLERYEWTPLNASAGQADNNRYLGNLGLKPEVAHGLNLGLGTRLAGHSLKGSLYVQHVRDYIVGTPFAHASGNVLRYENHDARLYGLDGQWSYKSGAWDLSGVMSYLRGTNLDSHADLYRIAPLRLTLQAGYQAGAWNNSLRARLARRQDHVTAYNLAGLTDEAATAGYAVFDWHARWQQSKHLKINLGIENLLDKLYHDHLDGINRVAGSDVPVGTRLPSPGRFAFVQLEWLL